MSLPSTGIFIAEYDGHQLCFDGKKWWSDDWPGFDERLAEFVNAESERVATTHSTIADIARRVLNRFFQGWKEVYFKSDRWETELPEGAID